MAAKGAIAKQSITDEILNYFPGSFIHDKVIRIPIMENGAIVEIKVALTCAKDVVGNAAVALSGDSPASMGASEQGSPQMTDAEKENVRILMKQLGM